MLGLIINGLLGLLSGESGSKVNTETYKYSGDGESYYPNHMESFLNRISGAGPTGQQLYSNDFSHNEAELAFNRSLMADSTKYQRSVADMAAAGINPMLAAGGVGGSSVSAPAATPSADTGASLGSILSFIVGLRNAAIQKKLGQEQLNIQDKVANANISKIEEEKAKIIEERNNIAADTQLKNETKRGQKIVNDFNENTAGLRREAIELSNNLTSEQAKNLIKARDEASARIKLAEEQAKSEVSKRSLNKSLELLNNAKAWQIAELTPFEKAYKSAATEEAKSSALLSAAHTAYQNGLIEKGYLDAFVDKAAAEAGIAADNKALQDIKTAIRTGEWKGDAVGAAIAKNVLTPIANILDNFNPINIFGK